MPTALVSGANRGLGLEFCFQLKELGYRVLALCRTPSDELKEAADLILSDVDVTDLQSLRDAASSIPQEKIDLLINNAGILHIENFPGLDFDSILRQFEVNSLGPLKVTEAFSANLNPKAKVVVVTSRMGSIADNTSGGYFGYRMSKAAVNAAFVSLAHALKPRGIAVGILHPGYVQTDMTRHHGEFTPAESVAGMLERIDELTPSVPPKFQHFQGHSIPW
ncbi:MAG: SDR family oxidoreductase [Chlamydiia bacterium]|nr:SDR family oxidoreductase [Chlamydiia bacterium]